jgi:hypothetical protein
LYSANACISTTLVLVKNISLLSDIYRYFRIINYLYHPKKPLVEILYHELTSWSRVLEKLIFTQTVKKFPPFMEPYRLHKNPPLVPILRQMNPVYISEPYFPKINSNSPETRARDLTVVSDSNAC